MTSARNLKLTALAAGALLVGVATAVVLVVQASDPWKAPASDMPPAGYPKELGAMAGEGLVGQIFAPAAYDMGLEIEWYAVGRRLSLLWGASPAGPGSVGISRGSSYSLPFWPTAIAKSPSKSGTYYVAGWTERDRTRVIELTISSPVIGTAEDPSGATTYSLTPGSVTRAVEIYDEATPVVGFIGNLFENRADPRHLFVHEYPSGSLYDLDLDTGSRALVASSTTDSPANDLTGPYNAAASMDHAVHGYSYILKHSCAGLGEATRPILVYFDADRDGAIDSVLNPTFEQYKQLDMLDPAASSGWD